MCKLPGDSRWCQNWPKDHGTTFVVSIWLLVNIYIPKCKIWNTYHCILSTHKVELVKKFEMFVLLSSQISRNRFEVYQTENWNFDIFLIVCPSVRCYSWNLSWGPVLLQIMMMMQVWLGDNLYYWAVLIYVIIYKISTSTIKHIIWESCISILI